MVLDQGTHVKVSSYGLSGYRRFTGQGSQDRRNNNRFFKSFQFGSTRQIAYENRGSRSGFEGSCMRKGVSVRTFVES